MCDYSLMSLPNRLAVCGEELIVHRFDVGSVGLTPSCNPGTAPGLGLLARLKKMLGSPCDDQHLAVCVPPGARLLVRDIPSHMQRRAGLHSSIQEVIFTQINVVGYRDAFRFSNGAEVLLQRLSEGQRVRVLAMSSEEETQPGTYTGQLARA